MAFRFRRSVKLGKGIRMNVSKRGIGMSFGKRGLRQSFHSTGSSTGTIGIPGTGLSYVKRKRSSKQNRSHQQKVGLSKEQRADQNRAIVKEYNDYLHDITHIHLQPVNQIDWEEVSHRPAPFMLGEEIGPLETQAVDQYHQYSPNVIEKIFKRLANKKKKQLDEEVQQAKQKDTAHYQTWEKSTDLANRVLLGKAEAYEQVIKENAVFDDIRKRGMSLRVLNAQSIEVEVQVSPHDVVPNKTLSLTKTGKVSKRKMGKTNYYKVMKDFVCSHVIWTARALFACLPIDSCIIHVNENAINTATGHNESRVLVSVLIDKQTLNQLNMKQINPSDAMVNFRHHMNHLKTKGFRPVERISQS